MAYQQLETYAIPLALLALVREDNRSDEAPHSSTSSSQVVQENYERHEAEASQIITEELERIKNAPVPCKLLPENNQ